MDGREGEGGKRRGGGGGGINLSTSSLLCIVGGKKGGKGKVGDDMIKWKLRKYNMERKVVMKEEDEKEVEGKIRRRSRRG